MNASPHHKSRDLLERGAIVMSDLPVMSNVPGKQLLHLVFGGELDNVADSTFKDIDKLDIVGIYPNYASAYAAWKAKAQGSVDNAEMRYFIVHMHRLLDPQTDTHGH
jgi:hypothetical protein